MSDTPQGEGWWQASDDRWYPPETHPDYVAPPPSDAANPGVPHGTGEPQRSSRMTLVIVGAILVVAVAGVVIAVAAVGGDDDTTSRGAVALDDGASFTEGCRYLGIDSFDDMQLELSFANPLPAAGDLVVSVAVLSPDGERVSTTEEFVDAAAAGELFRIDHDTLTDLPFGLPDETTMTCEILRIDELFFGSTGGDPGPGAACAFVEVDSFDDIQVELTVTNRFEETTDLAVRYALRGAAGIRFESSFAVIEDVEPDRTVRSEEDTLTEFPSWTSVSEFSCEVLDVESFGF